MNEKRMKNKIDRDKTQEYKELLAQKDLQDQAHADMKQKLEEEIQKHDKFLQEREMLQEQDERTKKQKEEDTAFTAEQQTQLDELKNNIDEQQRTLEDQTNQLEELKKTNRLEEMRAAELQRKYFQLKANQEYIKNHYDWKEAIKSVDKEAQVLERMKKYNNSVSLN